MNAPATIIVGGGLSALMAALFIRKVDQERPICVIEQGDAVGGLLRAFDCGEWGKFDQGMHTFTTSSLPELNRFVESLLPPEDWIYLRDAQRDISGLYYQDKLQHHCHYPDLRSLPPPILDRCASELQFKFKAPSTVSFDTMEQYGRERFGDAITREVIAPTLQKLYGRDPGQIDPVVAKLLPLDRVALFDEPEFKSMLPVDAIRSRVAYPEQRRLPLKYSSGHYSFYPKAFGAHRLVDAIVARLKATGVQLLTRTHLRGLVRDGDRITQVAMEGSEGLHKINTAQVYWTAGALPLARTLGLPIGGERFEGPKVAAVMNLLLDRPPNVGDLYYFWCFDPKYQAFRITNFHNYCPAAIRRGGYPVCVEFFLDPETPHDDASMIYLTVKELTAFGVLAPGTKILCHAGHVLPVGFPILSCHNRDLLNSARNDISGLGIANLALTGIQAEWGVVFQPDVLAHTYTTVSAMEGRPCL